MAPARAASPDSWTPPDGSEVPGEHPKDASRAGEFTMYFKSPFSAPAVNPMPIPATEPFNQPPSGSSKGEFTQLFGSSSPAGMAASAPPEPLLEPTSQYEGGGFTDVFEKPGSVRGGKSLESPISNLPRDEAVSSQPIAGYVVSQNTNLPPVPQPRTLPAEPAFRSSTAMGSPIVGPDYDERATRLFKGPIQEAPVAPSPVPRGESEYTQIIAPRPKPAAAGTTPAAQEADPGGGSLKLHVPVAPPPVPSLQPPSLQVAAPRQPAAPAVQWAPPPLPSVMATPPQMPSVPVPSVPTPKAGKKKSSWVSYAPLIVILNFLLLAAVSLILYFTVKR